jgi:peptidoglycan/LPS O-acetylase OafA/YrhL
LVALVWRGVAVARPLLANRPLLFVGRCSYSAYLYHLPLLLLWNRYAPRELGAMSLPLYLALVLAVSWSSWRFVELRFMRAGSRAAGAGADGERRNDGERLQERDTPEYGRVTPGVHEHAEGERGDGQSRVDA